MEIRDGLRESMKGLSVPSVEEIAADAVLLLGLGTLDLADIKDRQRLERALGAILRRELRWKLLPALTRATERAVAHVMELVGDQKYQEKRAERRKESLKRRTERAKEQAAQLQVEREAARQKRKGLLQ